MDKDLDTSTLGALRAALASTGDDLKAELDVLDDAFLEKFLRVRDHDPAKAAQLVVGYFDMRAAHPELFVGPLAEPKVAQVLRDGVFSFARKANSSGEMVIFMSSRRWDLKAYGAWDTFKATVVLSEYVALEAKKGFIEVQDVSGTTFKHLWATPSSFPKLASDMTERALPVNYSHIHIVNESRVLDIFYALMRPFLSKELKERLVFHGSNFDNLKDIVDADILPVEFGGQAENSSNFFSEDEIAAIDKTVTELWAKYPVKTN